MYDNYAATRCPLVAKRYSQKQLDRSVSVFSGKRAASGGQRVAA